MTPMESPARLWEIRWHGRGGQGAISAAQLLAHAAFLNGFRGVTSAPSFGAERRGAPVTASTRLSSEPIRTVSQIEQPDIVVVLDDSLLDSANATEGLKPGGWLILNTRRESLDTGLLKRFQVATVDATGAAREAGLVVAGSVLVNTPMLGAFARATGLVDLEHLAEALKERFPGAQAELNAAAARLTFLRTDVRKRPGPGREA